MTPEKLTELFRSWWKDSFPTITPNSRTVDTHVAFAAYVLSKNEHCVTYDVGSPSLEVALIKAAEQINEHKHKN